MTSEQTTMQACCEVKSILFTELKRTSLCQIEKLKWIAKKARELNVCLVDVPINLTVDLSNQLSD